MNPPGPGIERCDSRGYVGTVNRPRLTNRISRRGETRPPRGNADCLWGGGAHDSRTTHYGRMVQEPGRKGRRSATSRWRRPAVLALLVLMAVGVFLPVAIGQPQRWLHCAWEGRNGWVAEHPPSPHRLSGRGSRAPDVTNGVVGGRDRRARSAGHRGIRGEHRQAPALRQALPARLIVRQRATDQQAFRRHPHQGFHGTVRSRCGVRDRPNPAAVMSTARPASPASSHSPAAGAGTGATALYTR